LDPKTSSHSGFRRVLCPSRLQMQFQGTPEYWQTARQILPKHKHPHTGRSRYVPSVLASPSHTHTHTQTHTQTQTHTRNSPPASRPWKEYGLTHSQIFFIVFCKFWNKLYICGLI